MKKNRLTQKINRSRETGKTALIPFLPAGYPDKDRFWEEIRQLDLAGAEIIEIGVPFSDPMADGPAVEEASQRCLSQGVNLHWILEQLSKRSRDFQAEILLMGYYNPFLQFGLEDLVVRAAKSGVSGLIIPDLPFEENRELKNRLQEFDLDLIPLIGLNTLESRIEKYGENQPGFVYFVSVLGTTGARSTLPRELQEKLQKARSLISSPLVLGFGIKHPDQLSSIREYVDGVVFGSALIQHINSGGSSSEFMDMWR